MKHGGCAMACAVRSIERAARAARFRGKMGKGKISTEAFAPILGHPGAPIFRQTGGAGAGGRICAISHRCDRHSTTTPCSMPTEVEFPTVARAGIGVEHHTRTAVENSCTAVQHLTKALFLSKPTEPPLG